ncbi:hypothetical protein [Parachlamydia sp. AcF125]|uniref:hypothetical protein n=1 Tax=Parachlamydia sp. AcF125 TaxID=2795736 RepID=UPI001BC9D451|nr:hypothetical protein [Parachlamydia sp. AcF125]
MKNLQGYRWRLEVFQQDILKENQIVGLETQLTNLSYLFPFAEQRIREQQRLL